MAKDSGQDKWNHTLINGIAPLALQFQKTRMDYGELLCTAMVVTRLPSKVGYEWLNEVCKLSHTITALTYTPEEDIEQMLKSIGHVVSENQMIADGKVAADQVEKIRAGKIAEDGNRILDQIANNNESVGYLSFCCMVLGMDAADLQNKIRLVRNQFTGRRFSISPLPFLQQQILQTLSPCDLPNPVIQNIGNNMVPLRTVLGGFPFAFSGYNDGEGNYFGCDSSGAPVIIDLWRRGKDRNNSNLVAMGVSGAGKSTALKHLLENEWDLGTKILIIDPHGEYRDMCRNLDGDWINIAGGSGNRINPLQVYLSSGYNETEFTKTASPLATHIHSLEVFFRLYLDLNQFHIAALKHCLELTYREKGIVWDSDVSKLRNDQFPIMEDLYQTADRLAKETDDDLKPSERNYYKELRMLLREIAMGADSLMWNGASTVSPVKDFVVFDTRAFNGTSSNVKSALYHVVLNYCDDYLQRNPQERIVLVVDEAHNIIDKRIPDTVARLANMERSVRKSEGALWVCSHQLDDFLQPEIQKDGTALMEMPNIKLLMPVGKGRNLQQMKDLYNLTDAEEERLMQQQRGKGLLLVGSRRLSIDFVIPPFRFADMGTGGGR